MGEIETKEEKKGLVAEFKEFISRGSVMDLAVGLIIGTAFTAIVTSLVNDVIMPVVGYLIGGINFSDFVITLPPVEVAGATLASVDIKYGMFIQAIINFLVVALCVFAIVKAINKVRKKKEEAPAEPTDDQKLLAEIRDLLKEQNERAAK